MDLETSVIPIAYDRWAADVAPGMVWAVLRPDGTSAVHGLGSLRVGESTVPVADSIFRIASMTKCLTAATVLALRDDGLLGLDDPVSRYLPAASALAGPTSDAAVLTLRHLLTMTGGLATDDPWGDRQVPLPFAHFDDLLASGGIAPMCGPGEVYEYSNTGYALLGRVVSAVSGEDFADAVTRRLLAPLGMSDSGFRPEGIDADRQARGYAQHEGQLVEEPWTSYGAYSAMAGLHTTPGDLLRLIGWFLDAEPPRDGEQDGVLSRASRREMQRVAVDRGMRTAAYAGREVSISVGYGYGLVVEHDPRLGRLVGHSGGLPGFGSHMQWDPLRRIGILAFSNRTYAPMRSLIDVMLRTVLDGVDAVEPSRPGARTAAAADALEEVLNNPDGLDSVAQSWFADNMDLDVPQQVRARALTNLHERHGSFSPDPDRPDESDSSAHVRRWYVGSKGGVRVDVLMSPQRPSLVQSWDVEPWDDVDGQIRLRPFTSVESREVAHWRYEQPYDWYSGDGNHTDYLARGADGTGYLAVAHQVSDAVLGFVCLGPEGRVPGQEDVAGTLDIGMGVRPDLLSQGVASAALPVVIAFVRRRFPQVRRLRAAVWSDNARALALTSGSGMVEARRFPGPLGREFVELVADLVDE